MNYTEKTIGEYIDLMCEKYADREAVIFTDTDTRYTYKTFNTLYNNLAKGLIELGIKKGDRISIWALNCPEYIALQIATAKIGAILVCLNANYAKQEIEYALNYSESNTLILSAGFKSSDYLKTINLICPELQTSKPGQLKSAKLPKLKNIILLDNNNKYTYQLQDLIHMGSKIPDSKLLEITKSLTCYETVSFQFTSGTTGNPKAVMSNHFSIINNAIATAERFQYSMSDKLLICLPLFHVMGIVLSAIVCLVSGASMVLFDRFQTSKALSLVETEKCTALNAVPTMFKFMLCQNEVDQYNMSSLNKGMIGGSCCSPELLKSIIDNLHMKRLAVIYGQTEAMGITQTMYQDNIDKRINSVGKGYVGTEIKIMNPTNGDEMPVNKEGELCVKTPYIMNGYFKNKEATDKTIDCEGWLHTGDLATVDNDGYIKIIGRIKDIIIRGGENISPVEIEELLVTHNHIKDVAVVGVPDKFMGEELCAFIIPEDDCKIEEDQVKLFVKSNLARYKIPKYIEFTSQFPITSSGKIRKFMLRDIAIQKYNLKEITLC